MSGQPSPLTGTDLAGAGGAPVPRSPLPVPLGTSGALMPPLHMSPLEILLTIWFTWSVMVVAAWYLHTHRDRRASDRNSDR